MYIQKRASFFRKEGAKRAREREKERERESNFLVILVDIHNHFLLLFFDVVVCMQGSTMLLLLFLSLLYTSFVLVVSIYRDDFCNLCFLSNLIRIHTLFYLYRKIMASFQLVVVVVLFVEYLNLTNFYENFFQTLSPAKNGDVVFFLLNSLSQYVTKQKVTDFYN